MNNTYIKPQSINSEQTLCLDPYSPNKEIQVQETFIILTEHISSKRQCLMLFGITLREKTEFSHFDTD